MARHLNSSRHVLCAVVSNKLLHERYFLMEYLSKRDEKSTERRRDELRDGVAQSGSVSGVYFGRHRAE